MRFRVLLAAVFWAVLAMALIRSGYGQLREPFAEDDFTVREEMIPMRDGVKLYTIILLPKNAGEALPILLERTP